MPGTDAIKPSHKAIQRYYEALQSYGTHDVEHETALRSAFQNLLADTAKSQGWILVPELHHSDYREKFADNLKCDLPRLPFAKDFRAFSAAGEGLAGLHLDYEQMKPFPLKWIESKDVPLSYRIEDKMRLSKDKKSLTVNPSLTLSGIPSEAFRYRLGNRSAQEWVINQYQVTEDHRTGIRSDPNRADDDEYIVRLVGQVIQVSRETVRIVSALPKDYSG